MNESCKWNAICFKHEFKFDIYNNQEIFISLRNLIEINSTGNTLLYFHGRYVLTEKYWFYYNSVFAPQRLDKCITIISADLYDSKEQ